MGNMHIKNSVMDCSVSSDNYVRCRQNCVCDQNICDLNTCEVQKTKLIIGKDDKCTGMKQRHAARKLNINSTMEDHNNHDPSLTLKRPPEVKFDPSLRFFSITFLCIFQ